MEPGRLERVPELVEDRRQVRVTYPFDQPIDRIHPKTDRFHMEGGDGPAKRFAFLDQLPAVGRVGQPLEGWKERVEFLEGWRGLFVDIGFRYKP